MLAVSKERALLIEQVDKALIHANRSHRYRKLHRAGHLIKIRRGFYLHRSIILNAPNLLQRRLIIFIAQCITICRLAPSTTCLTHEAALVFLDTQLVNLPTRIRCTYQDHRWRLRTAFPEIRFGGELLAPTRVARFHRENEQTPHLFIKGLRLTSVRNLFLDLSLQGHQRSAFASSCLLLRRLLDAERLPRKTVRLRTLKAISTLQKELETKRTRKSKRVAFQFLQHLNAETESLPEATFVWDLYAYGCTEWSLQYKIDTFRVDVCFPRQRLIVEIEGDQKLGATDIDRYRSASSLINRAASIANRGFRVLAVSASDQMYRAGLVLTRLIREAPDVFLRNGGSSWCVRNDSRRRALLRAWSR